VKVVRLNVTPARSGPAASTSPPRRQWRNEKSVSLAGPPRGNGPQPERGQGPTPLKFKITPLKSAFADRPSIVLIHVLKTPMSGPHRTSSTWSCRLLDGRAGRGSPGSTHEGMRSSLGDRHPVIARSRRRPSQSIRHGRSGSRCLPWLRAKAGPLPIRITPRRIGELGVAFTRCPPPRRTDRRSWRRPD